MLWINYDISVDYLLIALLAIIVIGVSIWAVEHRRIGKSVSDLHETIDHEKVKYKELKSQMTNNIAHELRTPVSAIRGYLETLATCEDISPERQKKFIERAYDQSIRLSDLIRDIALLTKIEEARGHLDTEMVNFREVVNEVLDSFREKIQTNGDRIENMFSPGLEIMGNRTLIVAIFTNLIENSLKYAGNHVTIHMECVSYKSGVYTFKFYDTGVGVPGEHRQRIFERFYRITEGRTRDAGGSGLGLSIVRNAIAFHDGEITALSHHGGGLEYKFTLKDILNERARNK